MLERKLAPLRMEKISIDTIETPCYAVAAVLDMPEESNDLHKRHCTHEELPHHHHHDHKEDKEDLAVDENQIAVKKLQHACMCSLFFMCVQFVGGYYAGSLAIMTDAAHLLSDVASFAVSLFAMYIGGLPANAKMPFGYHRAEVLGALISVVLIWVLTIGLLYAAVVRIIEQSAPDAQDTVNGKMMFCVSSFGLIVNLVLMRILGHGHSHGFGGAHGHSHSHGHGHGDGKCKDEAIQSPNVQDADSIHACDGHSHSHAHSHGHSHGHGHGHAHSHQPAHSDCDASSSSFENINVRAAYIHALGDFIQSLGVCVAGALIWYNPHWQLADPITTILFSFLVLMTTHGIVKRSLSILMEAAPPHLDLDAMELQLRQLECVGDCHDLRVWCITDAQMAANVHIIPTSPQHAPKALRHVQAFFQKNGITYQTVQIDSSVASWEVEYDADRRNPFCTWQTFSHTQDHVLPAPRSTRSATEGMEAT